MKNIGVVLYKKGSKPGTLQAAFCHTIDGRGNGVAKGEATDGFEGSYRIKYFDEEGELQAERDLKIKRDKDRFELVWLNDGKVTSKGVGFETTEGLMVGYCDL